MPTRSWRRQRSFPDAGRRAGRRGAALAGGALLGAIILGVMLGNSATSGIAPAHHAARAPRLATAGDPARVARVRGTEGADAFDEAPPTEPDVRIFSAPPPRYEATAGAEAKRDGGFDGALDDGKEGVAGLDDPADDGAGK